MHIWKDMHMHRTTILLPEDLRRRAESAAASQGLSLSELIRRQLEKVASPSGKSDQSISFTDCVSFVLMRRESIARVFGFDRQFQAAQFKLWPSH